MLLAILAAAALAAPEGAQDAQPAPPTTVAPATVIAEKKKKDEPQVICVNERATGSHRMQRVCYDKNIRDQTQDALAKSRDGANVGRGGTVGGPR